MSYLIHASALLAVCFGYYWLVLRRETHFTLNRWVLLGCLIGSLALPFITVPAAWSLREVVAVRPIVEATTPAEDVFQPLKVPASDEMPRSTTDVRAPVQPFDWWRAIYVAYLIGVLVFAANFLLQLVQLVWRMYRSPTHDLGEFRLVEMKQEEAPFSFLNRIFLNPERYDPETFHQIVEHERIHVKQLHSLDLLLAEAVVIVQWFNPFAWLYRAAIEHNLEYLTDAEMLRNGTDPEAYQLSLVRVAVPNFPNGLVASYNQNFLEKRITMMQSRKSSFRSGWRYFILLPLLTLSVLQFNAVGQSVSIESPQIVSAPSPEFALPIDLAPAHSQKSDHAPRLNVPRGEMNSWTAKIEGDEICFQLRSDSNEPENRHNYSMTRCFDADRFGTLPRGSMGTFSLTRAAGTLNFKGLFDDNDGLGSFTFAPSPTFAGKLEQEGYGTYSDHETLLLFLGNMDEGYLSFLAEQGYKPSHQQLIELSIFFDDRQEISERITDLSDAGFGKPELQKLIELQIHGVTGQYAKELSKAGYKDLDLQDVIEAKIHGLSASFLATIAESGYSNVDFDRAKSMAIHGIDEDYIREMNRLGYTDLSAKDIVNAKIHGIDAAKIAELRQAGFEDLSLEEAKKLSIHGITPRYVAELKAMGYEDLPLDDFLQAKIHGITPGWVAEFNDIGYADIPFRTLMQLRIHGVSASFIEERRREGYELKDYVKLKMHGL